MSLTLENVSRVVNGEHYISDVNITFLPGSFNVLLGRTLAGKTSLMRLIAGLDKPTSGRVLVNNEDVTGVPVQRRNIAMVYQQFINYPSLTVFENIASPLRIAKISETEINHRVQEVANMLHIENYLQRFPLELSGGQQQRTAMARALIKEADIILFDEPLVNLDYKLREELRFELRELFKVRNTIAIYASTEPAEALALGGGTSLLHEGRVVQTGSVEEVYSLPNSIMAAELFSEPPINVFKGGVHNQQVTVDDSVSFILDSAMEKLPDGECRFGIRPHHISLSSSGVNDFAIDVRVDVAEISGSETFLHLSKGAISFVVQLQGIYHYQTDTPLKIYLPLDKLYVFDQLGETVHAPQFAVKAANGHFLSAAGG